MLKFLQKRKKIIVVKLFKIVTYSEASGFKTEAIIDFCLDYLGVDIDYVSWNYGNKTWKKYSSFKNFMQKSGKETVELSLYADENQFLCFGNELLNQMNVAADRTGTVELTIYLNDGGFGQHFYSDLFKKISKVEIFDCGYVCSTTKKKAQAHDVIVNVHNIDITNNKTFDVKNGYIRDVYGHNLLNLNQLTQLGNLPDNIAILSDISDDLKLWTLTDEEIEKVKSILSLPIEEGLV